MHTKKMKQPVIGIPRALLYYSYNDQWKRFFEGIDCRVMASPETSARILRSGIMHALSDLCLPLKTFLGHVAVLKDSVDALFIPRYVSVEQESYMCPKMIGLPDVVRASFSNLPPIIAPVMHYKQFREGSYEEFVRPIAKMFSVRQEKAAEVLRAAERDSRELPNLYHEQSESLLSGSRGICSAAGMNIGIIGRPYLLFDNHLSKNMFRFLKDMGATPIYLRPSASDIREAMTVIPKWIYWDMGKEVVTAAHCCFRDDRIHGVINLCSAACGPDSFTGDLIKKRLNPGNKPYMSLSIDEHTSDVGLHTRIEAFIDMIGKVTV